LLLSATLLAIVGKETLER